MDAVERSTLTPRGQRALAGLVLLVALVVCLFASGLVCGGGGEPTFDAGAGERRPVQRLSDERAAQVVEELRRAAGVSAPLP